MRIAFALLFVVMQSASAHDANSADPCQKALLTLKFKSVKTSDVRDQCESDTCWIHQELAFLEAGKPQRFSADYLIWAHLRQSTVNALLDEPDARKAVEISLAGHAEHFDLLKRAYGLLPEGAWTPKPLTSDKVALTRLTVELSWLNRILREELNAGRTNQKGAVARIDQLLTLYFGSLPPASFYHGRRKYTAQEFENEFGAVMGNLSWGREEVFLFPEVYPSEQDLRRHQTAVALQLRKTGRPIRVGIRYLKCFEDKDTGLLSIRQFANICINPLWVNKLTPETDPNGLHAVLLTGYTIKNGEFYFEFQNSWGKGWGRDGRGVIDPSYWPMVTDALLYSRFTDPLK